ncbi:hypothetical protein FM107_13770 [Sphingobacterium sp. JB170]|nr:hypothetical protein FM107_13770 [Sphingobacterium sp. JB170]
MIQVKGVKVFETFDKTGICLTDGAAKSFKKTEIDEVFRFRT